MEKEPAILAAYRQAKAKILMILVIMLIAVLVMAVLSGGLGSMKIAPVEVLRTFFGKGDPLYNDVIFQLRLPRVLTAILAGFGLGISGCVMQSLLHNPLASASTLGVSQGAAFGATVAIMFLGAGASQYFSGVQATALWGNPYITTICAFCGSMLVTLFVLVLSRFRSVGPSEIVLVGVALSSIFSGGTALMQYFASDIDLSAIVFWTFGDMGRTTYETVAIIAVVVAVTSVYFCLNAWNYNAINSGRNTATGLGVNVKTVLLVGLTLASLVVSTIVSFIGVVNFIGLIAPHMMRRLVGEDNRFLLPASMLCGALILLVSDLLARMIITPIVLPIGAITSFMGAPLFVYIMLKGGRGHARDS